MKKEIQQLLDHYFEGLTSAEEEKALRRYFAEEDLPEELKPLIPLFRFMDDEATALAVLNEVRQESNGSPRRTPFILRRLRTVAAVAAVLLMGILLVTRPEKSSPTNGSYAWVDGKQVTDPVAVQRHAEQSLGRVISDQDLMEEQLNFVLE